jgi:hypothetical protein
MRAMERKPCHLRSLAVLLVFTASAAAQSSACEIKGFGDSCGPALAAVHSTSGSLDTVTLTVAGGLPDGLGIHILGREKVGVDIPVYGCKLLASVEIVLLFATDKNGFAQTSITVPGPIIGRYFAQSASFRLLPNILQATNGLEFDCRLRR